MRQWRNALRYPAPRSLKLIRDIDDIIAETSPMIAAHGLDLDTVRDALLFEFAGGRG